MVNYLNPVVSVVNLSYRPGGGSLQKDCCWRLTFRLHERQSSSKLSEEWSSDVVYMPMFLAWIGQFCRDRQNVKVAVIGRLLFCSYFRSVYCLLVSFEVMYESFMRCRQFVGIGLEVLLRSLCTSFLMPVVPSLGCVL